MWLYVCRYIIYIYICYTYAYVYVGTLPYVNVRVCPVYIAGRAWCFPVCKPSPLATSLIIRISFWGFLISTIPEDKRPLKGSPSDLPSVSGCTSLRLLGPSSQPELMMGGGFLHGNEPTKHTLVAVLHSSEPYQGFIESAVTPTYKGLF